MKQLSLLLLLLCLTSQAEILDRTALIINDKMHTLSEINRIQQSLSARKEIALPIYGDTKEDTSSIIKVLVKRYIIKDKLQEMGIVVGDPSVESQIDQILKRTGLGKDQLISFLKQQGISFGEYFELQREYIEFDVFIKRILAPLVNVTEQEIKNQYSKAGLDKAEKSSIYSLIDYIIPLASVSDSDLKDIGERIENSKNLKEEFKGIESVEMNDLTLGSLGSNIQLALANIEEGGYSHPIKIDQQYHVFKVVEKVIGESKEYLQAKEKIKAYLYSQRVGGVLESYLERETPQYYIKKLIP
ncbi:MAG: peptidyl-prolyl cis-trans isomerase [Halobacteriovoraceae bacterium]|nr:peptidyl-prolyl cis-trans isomerase [Halobacteriovoraceae bacterium]